MCLPSADMHTKHVLLLLPPRTTKRVQQRCETGEYPTSHASIRQDGGWGLYLRTSSPSVQSSDEPNLTRKPMTASQAGQIRLPVVTVEDSCVDGMLEVPSLGDH